MEAELFADTPFGGPARKPGDRWAFTYYMPKPLPRSLTLEPSTVLALSEADSALGLLNGLGRLVPDPEILLGPFLAREALASSKIEGTNASLSEVLQVEAVDQPPNDDVREVLNYLRASNQGIRLIDELPLAQRLIKAVHKTLMQGVRGADRLPGDFRSTPVWVGGPDATPETARFVPPLPEHIGALIDDWERFVNEPSQLPTLIRCALMHYQFETIHPFLDGNGRIGRLAIGLMLIAERRLSRPLLYLSSYLESHRDEYYGTLQAVRESGALEPYLRFFLGAVRRQANDAVHRAGTLVELRERYLRQVRLERSRIGALIPIMFSSPYFSTRLVESSLGITSQGARNLLSKAQALGWVNQAGSRGRGGLALWSAGEVFRAIEQPYVYAGDGLLQPE